MKIIIGADHGGFELKEKIKNYFNKNGVVYTDIGTHGGNPKDDYSDYAFKLGKMVSKDSNVRGILICGSGAGMVIAVNKVKGIRATIAYDSYSAKMARVDNNTNVICLRERRFSVSDAKKIVSIWLDTDFSNLPRHKKRLKKIENYERKK